MTRHTVSRSLIWLALVAMLVMGVSSQAAMSPYEQLLRAIPVTSVEPILLAIARGTAHGDFPEEPLLHLLHQLQALPAPAPEKEGVVLVLAEALSDDLPIQHLVSKGLEGLARGVPLLKIRHDLHARHRLMTQTRTMLEAKGIFALQEGLTPLSVSVLPVAQYRMLLLHVSEPIADFLAAGRNPLEDPAGLHDEVRTRLTLLQGVTLLAEDVLLVLERVEPSDLVEVVLAANRG